MDTNLYSKKPKLNSFSESIFTIGDNGEVKIGGKLLPLYKCTIHSTLNGIGYQLFYDDSYLGGYHHNEFDIFTTINNHELYLEEVSYLESEIMELEENLNELESQTENNTDEYYNLVGGRIEIEDLETNIFELTYLLESKKDELLEFNNQSIPDWNC